MVGRDVHQYSDVGTEVVHVVELERTELNHVVVVLFSGHLQGKATAYVASKAHVETGTLQDVVDERGSGSLAI